MVLSDLIKRLKKIKKRKGNLEVVECENDDYFLIWITKQDYDMVEKQRKGNKNENE